MENMEYYTQRLQCSDEEKDACLETVAKIFRLRLYIHRSGRVAAQILAVSYTQLTLPTINLRCRSRWSPNH